MTGPSSLEADAFRVVGGLAVIRGRDEVVVLGRPRPTRFEGRSAMRLVPRVLGALRESPGTAHELAERLALPAAHVEEVLRLASAEGIVEPAREGANDDSETHRFWGRMCGRESGMTTRSTVEALESVKLDFVGHSELAGCLEACARDAGMAATPADGAPTADGRGPARRLTVVAAFVDEDDERDRIEETCARLAGSTVLPVLVGAAKVALGPVIDAPNRGFVEATWLRMAELVVDDDDPDAAEELVTHERVAMLVAARLAGLLSQAVPGRAADQLLTHGFSAWRTTSEPWAPLEHDERRSDPGAAVQRYERSVELRGADAIRLPEITPTQRGRLAQHRRSDAWTFDSHPRIALPFVNDPPHGDRIDEQGLSYLLQRVTGFHRATTRHRRRRWVPSGGDLGSTTAFVTIRETSESHVLFYDAARHSLVYAERPVTWNAHRSSNSTFLIDATAVSLVLVAHTSALTPRYGPFSFKLAHLDAGCAAAQAMMLARRLGTSAKLRMLAVDGGAAAGLPLRRDDDLPVAEILLTPNETNER